MTTKIKVVEVKKKVIDLLTSPVEEIGIVIAKDDDIRHLTFSFTEMARQLQGPRGLFARKRVEAPAVEILIRELVQHPAFVPVISRTSIPLKLRPAMRTRALFRSKDAAVASEETVGIVGIVVDPARLNVWIPPVATRMRSRGDFIPPLPLVRQNVDFENGGTNKLPSLFVQAMFSAEYVSGPGVSTALTGKVIKKPAQEPHFSREKGGVLRLRGPKEQEQLEFLLRQLARGFTIAEANPDDYDSTALFNLYRAGAFSMYLFVLTEGRESATVNEFIVRSNIAASKRRQLDALQAAEVESIVLARQYLIIIEDKLGATRLEEINAKRAILRVPNSPQQILQLLNAKEREIVKTTYENRIAEWKSQLTNKCPHVRLASRLRRVAAISEAMEILEQLMRYADPRKSNKTDWMMCRNCGFRLICPHVRARLILESKLAPYEEIRASLMKFASKAGLGGEDYAYFCNICDEKIGEVIDAEGSAVDFAESQGRFGEVDADIRTYIWTECLRALDTVKFAVPIDPKQFANMAVGVIYPLVVATDEKLIRQRRAVAFGSDNDDQLEIDPRAQLFIVLYIYAYILNLIDASANGITFDGIKPGAKASVFADAMMKHIILTKASIISQIPDITPDFILGRFKEAFRLVHGAGTSMKIKAVSAEEELANQIINLDPIYYYAGTYAKIVGALPINPKDTPDAAKKEFETIMGTSLPQLIKRARENAKNPELSQYYSNRLAVDIPAGTTLEFVYRDPRINIYTNLFSEKQHGFSNDLTHASYALFHKYIAGITDTKSMHEYQNELTALTVKDDTFINERLKRSTPALYAFGFALKVEDFRVPLGTLYDENGIAHVWNIYVFGSVDVVVNLGSSKDDSVAKARANGVTGLVTDEKCSICGILRSAARGKALDDAKVASALLAATKIESFFTFYESRCPESGLHEWTDMGLCQKCGASTKYFVASNTPEASRMGYFEKYSQTFAKEREEALMMQETATIRRVVPPPAEISWQPDYNVVLQTSELIPNITPALLESIGMFEGRAFDDIKEGKDVPVPNRVHVDIADSCAREVAAAFNRLRHAARYARPPPFITDVLDAAGVQKFEYLNLRQLPDISDGYTQKRISVEKELSTSDLHKFIIESICKMLLKAKSTGAVGKVFAEMELADSIRRQRLLSKFGTFNFSIFITGDDGEDGVDTGTDTGDVDEDVVEKIDENSTEDGAYNPFSLENMDYDGHNADTNDPP